MPTLTVFLLLIEKKKLEEYLSSFSNRDCIPNLPDSELSVLIESDSESDSE